jgi:hypothetical protein
MSFFFLKRFSLFAVSGINYNLQFFNPMFLRIIFTALNLSNFTSKFRAVAMFSSVNKTKTNDKYARPICCFFMLYKRVT